jgi:hypothetical protein
VIKFFAKKQPPTLQEYQTQRGTLAGDLEKAQAAATTARDRCSDVAAGLLAGDLADVEAQARACEDRVASLRVALEKLDGLIAAAEAATAQAKLEADRACAEKYLRDIADRADAEFAVHEQWLLNEMATVINAYRAAIGHLPADFTQRHNNPSRVNLNDLQVAADQLRQRADRIAVGRDDDALAQALGAMRVAK